ncbi:uncharacterized protein C594.04c [Apium graveolens]|uniref:uncharacterized protein C594.04c n=1 Tax=Apium graveolens TaxID=4045 RepID=UPI003D7B59CC
MVDNLKNLLIAIVIPLPSVIFYLHFVHNSINTDTIIFNWVYNCHPLLLANILFFFNVNLLFWLIALVQSSHWMIDLYWTVIPVLLLHYYATHPLAQFNTLRSWVVILLTWFWSLRLTHSYLRRENWQWGAREDWRFSDMRTQFGRRWWWISFFSVYMIQQVFLIGICLPLYVVHSVNRPCNIWDFLAIIICLLGVVVAYIADTQLYKFVTTNNKLKELGKPTVPYLDKGLWHYSRHPNYFGEQLWWWGLGIFAWNLGQSWTLLGALVNSMCLAYVTVLVEERMLKQESRAEAYWQYQKTTSVWIPWFKSHPRGKKNA